MDSILKIRKLVSYFVNNNKYVELEVKECDLLVRVPLNKCFKIFQDCKYGSIYINTTSKEIDLYENYNCDKVDLKTSLDSCSSQSSPLHIYNNPIIIQESAFTNFKISLLVLSVIIIVGYILYKEVYKKKKNN